MIFERIRTLFANEHSDREISARSRDVLKQKYSVIYAIGDVHGRLDLLRQLEAKIVAHEANTGGPKLIVQLGDMIDRGPHSAQVIDHMLSRTPEGWSRLALAGNHETTLCDAMSNSTIFERWLGFGGMETLGSYGIGQREIQSAIGNPRRIADLVQASFPPEHIKFLFALPLSISVGHAVFMHAGGRPGVSPDAQEEKDILWYTGERDDTRSDGALVVHGHEIVPEPEIYSGRINVDTGAYRTGILSAVRLASDAPPRVLNTSTDV
ncbi:MULTISPECIES: metallophosphoesterase [unclassified Devosia]|uniref:metallophosphoesterase n=1 Tax=unclassified Devosia TaxID=196773 RepID=UPI00145C988B|nr:MULTISPECIES: metallophosphoesterase [unclassified Devosia]MBJ6989219.1 serine/threonine protein phosphatase [Devosia sp. MC521]QMW63339.1 serine/threonine protein phosphatase [Devosia sp. MC521]